MINHNGELFDVENATISYRNRGLQYGDALFDTLKVVNSRILFWESHYFRLMASMRLLRMQIPMYFSPEFLEEEIQKTLERNDVDNKVAKVKINIFRKFGGLYLPEVNGIDYIISCEKIEHPFYILDEDDYEVELFKDHFVKKGILSTLKTNNKLINILGSIYAKENGYHNCLLLNEKKSVVEFTNANVFIVHNHIIKTPPLSDGCLQGIIRERLIEIIQQTEDYKLVEESISPFELQKADEMFMTNTILGIKSITKYRKKIYTNYFAKKIVGKLNAQARFN